jgi:uncharacterized protein YecE (DUF72 family)
VFAIKAHQFITHIERLREVGETTTKSISLLQPTVEAKKLGPVLFQLPPNLIYDPVLLEDFLSVLPRKTRATMEFQEKKLVSRRRLFTSEESQCSSLNGRKR